MTYDLFIRDGTVVDGLGDGGAHYGMICNASFPTYLLTHWVRELTSAPARVAGDWKPVA